MILSELRKYYLKVALVFYSVWVVIFIGEGLYTVTLPTHDPTSWVDKQIPVVSEFVWLYVLCYVFPLVPIVVSRNWHRFNLALMSVAICTLIAFAGHLLIPVAFPRPQLGSTLSDWLLFVIYANDFRPGAQNFPSLHVAVSWIVYFACRGHGLSRLWESVILLTACLIIVSTVLIKQHIFIDLIGGTVLAFVVWFVGKRYYYSIIEPNEDTRHALKHFLRKTCPVFISSGLVLLGIVSYQILR